MEANFYFNVDLLHFYLGIGSLIGLLVASVGLIQYIKGRISVDCRYEPHRRAMDCRNGARKALALPIVVVLWPILLIGGLLYGFKCLIKAAKL